VTPTAAALHDELPTSIGVSGDPRGRRQHAWRRRPEGL
jgi:hypothetical protein